MKMFAICRMSGGLPDIDTEATPYHGHVLCDQIGQWGAYLFSGTGQQMVALDALPQMLGIVAVTETDQVKWGELDGQLDGSVRTKLNTWLSNHGYPTIPEGWSNRRVVREIYRQFNARFDLAQFDVCGP